MEIIMSNHKNDGVIHIDQLAESQGKKITEGKYTFNHQKVFKISGEKGLYTFDELKKRFLN